MRDQRAAPLYSYLVRQMDRGQFPQLYLTAIEALGAFGGADAIEALKVALHTRPLVDARSPTAKYGGAAAHALRRIGTRRRHRRPARGVRQRRARRARAPRAPSSRGTG